MGRRQYKQRPQVGVLGKDLTRRSRGRCELCEGREGVRPWELPPFPPEPDPDRTLMTCARCRTWLEGGDIDPLEAAFLEGAVWAMLPPVQLAAARLVLRIDDPHAPHVRDALDHADIDPTTGEFRDAPSGAL